MLHKLLIKAFGLKKVIEDELKEEYFPVPKYIHCCSGEEEKQVIKAKKELQKKAR